MKLTHTEYTHLAGLMRNILYPSGKASYIVKQQQDEVVDNSVVDQLEKNAANVEVNYVIDRICALTFG